MKRLLALVIFITIPFLVRSQTTGDAKISFQSETIDFGTVVQGSEQIRTFTITNTGTTPLIITQIRGACGCTTFPDSWPKDPVQPGATVTFRVKYDTSVRVGMFDKQVMVYSNAVNNTNGMYTVKIKGNVVASGAATAGTNGN